MLTNKYAEGYPGRRYYGGCEYVDIAEQLAIDRAKALFGAEHANVQPHSGAQANTAVYHALLQPGDTLHGPRAGPRRPPHARHEAQRLRAGCTRSSPTTSTARPSLIDMDEVARLARERRPKMIIAGWSAYPRMLDFAALPRDRRRGRRLCCWSTWPTSRGWSRRACTPARCRCADVVTTTIHKTLGGGRAAGMILCKRGVRQEDRLGRVPRPAGRPAGARHRRQGGGAEDRGHRGVPRAPAAHARGRPRASPPSCWRRAAASAC